MPTGACGINCDVCQLRLLGICSSCGPGKSSQAEQKLAVQKVTLGDTCAILECAHLNQIDYCMRDCGCFPCDNFSKSTYPFGSGYLNMQQRRRQMGPPATDPAGRPIQVSKDHWEALAQKDVAMLCNFTLADRDPDSGMMVYSFLEKKMLVDIKGRCIRMKKKMGWEKTDNPLLELVTTIYLNRATMLFPMGRGLVSTQDLKDFSYFSSEKALRIHALVERFGNDPKGFAASASYLKGEPMDMADTAYRLLPYPRIPVYYLLWHGDEEFGPRMSILFDRSIEKALNAPAIWSLVTLCSYALLKGPVINM